MSKHEEAKTWAKKTGSSGNFPLFNAHLEAVCYNCDGHLEGHAIGGHAPRFGAYRGHCKACDTSTWYDCAESTVELIRACEWRARGVE